MKRPRYEGLFMSIRDTSSSEDESSPEEKSETDSTGRVPSNVTSSPGWTTKRQKISDDTTDPPEVALEKMKNKLFNKICAGDGLDTFHLSMKEQDEKYIESLTGEIEDYVDLLSASMGVNENTWDGSHIQRQGVCGEYTDHCFNETICRKIPGFRSDEPGRGFIPQMYHILQDYGFFMQYIGLDNISSKLPMSELIDWFIHFGRVIGRNEIKYGKTPVLIFLDMMMIRMRRVQFLRSFETYCCLGLERSDESHIPIDDALEEIYQAVYRTKKDVESD